MRTGNSFIYNMSSCSEYLSAESAPKGRIARGWSTIFLHNSHEASLVCKTQGMCGAIKEKKVLLQSRPWGNKSAVFDGRQLWPWSDPDSLGSSTQHCMSTQDWWIWTNSTVGNGTNQNKFVPVCTHYNISQVICLATTAKATCLSQKYTVVATTSCFSSQGHKWTVWFDQNFLHRWMRSQSRPRKSKGTRLGHRLRGWVESYSSDSTIKFLQIVRVNWIPRLPSELEWTCKMYRLMRLKRLMWSGSVLSVI